MSLAAENKVRRRNQILEAAERLIRQSGAVDFSMVVLAKEAGVSFATPFNQFGRKSGILRALLSARIDAQFETLSFDAEIADPLYHVLRLTDQSIRIYLGDTDLYRPIIRAAFTEGFDGDYEPPEKVIRMWQMAVEPIAKDLVPGVQLDQIALKLHLTFTSSLISWSLGLHQDDQMVMQTRQVITGVLCQWLDVKAQKRVLKLLADQ